MKLLGLSILAFGIAAAGSFGASAGHAAAAPAAKFADVGQANEQGNIANAATPAADSSKIEQVIAEGMKYKGTPYEFGADRESDATFDCSSFLRWIFRETLGVTLPGDSRAQGDYVKNNGSVVTDIGQLKRGDLVFFMEYKGGDEGDYAGIDKSSERITHVGIYLGDGNLLHTYSVESGGVTVTSIVGNSWEHRFLFGGSAL